MKRETKDRPVRLHALIRAGTLLALLFAFGAPGPRPWAAQEQAGPRSKIEKILSRKHAPGEFLVVFKPGTTAEKRAAVQAAAGATVRKRISLRRGDPDRQVFLYHCKGAEADALKTLTGHADVLYAGPNFRVYKDDQFPNDADFGDLWGQHNVGQTVNSTSGLIDADMDLPEAWDLTTGDPNVVVAVLDTGVDYTHPDLAANMWINAAEQAGTPGVDDDGNGYIDDVYGYDFAGPGDAPAEGDEDSDPMDIEGHGTHVSGTIGAVGNNAIGVAGVAWNVKIMALRFLAPDGGWTSDAVQAYAYLTDMKTTYGVNIVAVNNSWGGGGFDGSLYTAMDTAASAGIISLCAAGNDGLNTDDLPHYPSSYDLDGIVSVSASDNSEQSASFSNFGFISCDLFAPGVNIWSTIPGSGYTFANGTSMATPQVTGVTALIKSLHPAASVAEVRARLLFNVDQRDSYAGRVATGGRLNAFRALQDVDTTDPGTVTSLAVASTSYSSALLSWDAPGDDGAGGGRASLYEIRRSTSAITSEALFDAATPVVGPPAPLDPGTTQYMKICGLDSDSTYFFALRAIDNVGNASGISNSPSGTTDLASAASTVFFDDFQGNGSSFDAAKWTENPAGNSWARRNSGGSKRARSNGGISYANDLDIAIESTAIDLTGLHDATLTFVHSYSIELGWDFGFVEVSADGGSSWTWLAQYTGSSGGYVPVDRLCLSAYDGLPDVRIRFRLFTDFIVQAAGWAVDDVTVLAESSGGNTDPTAVADAAGTNENQPVDIDVLSNDSDADGDPLWVAVVTQGTNGSVMRNGDGTVRYTPDPGTTGVDTFSYTLSDGNGGTDSAIVTVTVTAVNDPPTAFNDADATLEEVAVDIDVKANDTDPEGDPLTVIGVTNGSNGTVIINGDQTVKYTPDPDFDGVDNFTYTIQDTSLNIDVGTVTVTVSPVNDDPDAVDDADSTAEDTPVDIDVTANDTDVENDPLTVTGVTQGANGSVSIVSNMARYSPNPDYNGPDSFTYTIVDGNGGSDTATVNVTVSAQPDPPTAADDGAVTDEDTAVLVDVVANDDDPDGDALTVSGVADPPNGTAQIIGNQVQYTPDADFNGPDSFDYTVSDGNGGSDTGTVNVTVNPQPDPPDAVDDPAVTDEDVAVDVDVKANDSDPDGDTLTVTAVTQGTNGSVLINGNQTVKYTPNGDYNGPDSFTYTISDGNGGTDVATVNVTVNPQPDPPDAVDDPGIVTLEDTAVDVNVKANDTDPENDTLTVVSVTQGTSGAVSINVDQTVRYLPNTDFNGGDSFTYTIDDGNGGQDTATVTVTVTPQPDPPDAVDDPVVTLEDTAVDINVKANDSDPDGDPLTVESVTQGATGVVVINPDNTVRYTPLLNFVGADAFTYTINDGTGRTDTATVNVTIDPDNDAPTLDTTTSMALTDVSEDDVASAGNTVAEILATGAGGDPISDIDAGAVEGIAVTSADETNGIWEFSVDGGSAWAPVGAVSEGSARLLADLPLNRIRFVPALDYHGTTSIAFRAWDRTAGADGTLDDTTVNGGTSPYSVDIGVAQLNVLPINDAPVLDNSVVMALSSIAEDDVSSTGNTIAEILGTGAGGDPITDIDPAPLEGIALTSADTLNGAWEFSQNGGGAWSPIGGVADATALLLPVDPQVRLRFVPNPSYNGPATVGFRAWDRTSGAAGTLEDVTTNGGTTAWSTASGSAQITVTGVNDPPAAADDATATTEDVFVDVDVKANDTDPENDTLTVTSVGQGANGSVIINGDQTVRYTPDADFNGADAFTYTVSDGNGGSDTATVSVTVNAAPDPPVAVDDAAVTSEDTAVVVDVRLNDSDPDGDTLTVTLVTQGADGSVTINGGLTVTYTPDADFNGPDSFTYTIGDGTGNFDTATVNVTVNPAPDPPTAVDDAPTTPEDTPLDTDVKGNDTDPENDPLTVVSVTQSANGTVSINPDNTVRYVPDPDYNGFDTFSYTIDDGNGGQDTASVTVDVTPQPDPPNAADDPASTPEDVFVDVDVKANDTDPENDTLTVVSTTDGTNGTTAINPDQTVRYTPAVDFNGVDTFTYTIDDGNGGQDSATVTVTVNPMPDPPDAVDDPASTPEDTPVDVDVRANDTDPENDPLTVTGVTQGTNGSVSINPDQTVRYSPNPDFNGVDTFTYTISDGSATDAATVTVTVDPVQDPPTAVDDAGVVTEDIPGDITVKTNDSDPDGDAITVVSSTDGANGTTSVNPDETIRYTPTLNFNGQDTFTYTIDDGNGNQDVATVTVTVTPAQDPPDAVDDPGVVTAEDTAVDVNVKANDSDPENDPLTVTGVTQGTSGAVSINPDQTVRYVPNLNYNGGDSFTYTITDGQGNTDTATVTVTVNPAPDPPDAVDDPVVTPEDQLIDVDVRGNDTDPEGDALTVVSITQPANGTAAINPDQTVRYTPALDYNGPDAFTYTVDDGNGGQDTASVDVTVTPEKDPPTADPQAIATAEDTAVAMTLTGSDPDGDPLTFLVATPPANGVISGTPPTVTYTPNLNYNGPDSFTFTANDGTVDSPPATISITVSATNDPPVADAQAIATAEDTPVAIALTGSDLEGNPLTFAIGTGPSSGSLLGTPPNVTYVPDAEFGGPDSFTFTVNDGIADSAPATVDITVTPVDDPPAADPQGVATAEDVSLPIVLTGTDPEGSPLTFTVTVPPANGTLTGTEPNVTYVPDPDFNGADSFQFTANDGGQDGPAATVDVTVTPVPDPPIATPQSPATPEDTALPLTLAGTDPDGDPLTYAIAASPSNGTLSGTPPNVTYVPAANFTGLDSFTFTVDDGTATSSPAAVTIDVTPQPDPPSATPQAVVALSGRATTITLTGTDPDGDALTFTITVQPLNGTLSGAGAVWDYTPNGGYTGPDTLEFTVSDGTFTSAPALVSIDVQPAPAAAGGGGGGGGSCGSFGFDLLWPLGLLMLFRRSALRPR